MLAQGGEFAFVLLSLAAELKVLPEELNKLLIIVVVISMALTPGLASVGKYLADKYPEEEASGTLSASPLWKKVCQEICSCQASRSAWVADLGQACTLPFLHFACAFAAMHKRLEWRITYCTA